METSFSYSDDIAYFSSDEWKWIKRIRKLKEEHPDEVTVLNEPETNDGCIYAKIPKKWLYIRPPVVRIFTEEQKEAGARRLREAREKLNEQKCKCI